MFNQLYKGVTTEHTFSIHNHPKHGVSGFSPKDIFVQLKNLQEDYGYVYFQKKELWLCIYKGFDKGLAKDVYTTLNNANEITKYKYDSLVNEGIKLIRKKYSKLKPDFKEKYPDEWYIKLDRAIRNETDEYKHIMQKLQESEINNNTIYILNKEYNINCIRCILS